MILDGEVDYLPEPAFLNVGTIEEAIEKGKKLLEQAKKLKIKVDMMKEVAFEYCFAGKGAIQRGSEECYTAGNDRIVFYPAAACADCLFVERGKLSYTQRTARNMTLDIQGGFVEMSNGKRLPSV